MTSSSSTQPLASERPVQARPALGLHERRRRHDVAEPAQGDGQVDVATAGAHDVDGADVERRPVLGHDEEPGAAGEQVGVGGDTAPRDHADAQRGLLRWPVALRPQRSRRRRGRRRRLAAGRPGRSCRWRSRGRPSGRRRPSCRRGWRSCRCRPTGRSLGRGRGTPYRSSTATSPATGWITCTGCLPRARSSHVVGGRRRAPRDRASPERAMRSGEHDVAHTEIHRVVPLSPHRGRALG